MSKKRGKKRAAGDLREIHAALNIGYGFDAAGGAYVILKFGSAEAWVEAEREDVLCQSIAQCCRTARVEAANRVASWLATVSLRDVVRLNGDGE